MPLFGGTTTSTTIQAGCTGSCEAAAAAMVAPQSAWAAAWGVLSGVIGTYGYIKQYQLQSKMVDLAERAQDRADAYLTLAQDSYYNIAKPTHDRLRALYDRYKGFWARENDFITCAFALKEYCPDYALAEGRAVARVRRIWDQAIRARQRATGRFNTGRACHDLSYMSGQRALALVTAASDAFRHEDRKKFEYDRWYWDRWKAGWNAISHMGDRGVQGLVNGAGVVNRALDDVSRGIQLYQSGVGQQAAAIGNQAAFWGNIGQGGLGAFGNALGSGYFDRGGGTYYEGAPSTGWATAVYPGSDPLSTSFTGMK